MSCSRPATNGSPDGHRGKIRLRLASVIATAVVGASTVAAQTGPDTGFLTMPGSGNINAGGGNRSYTIRAWLPPMPPRMGAAIAEPQLTRVRRTTARKAPDEMAAYVNEIFYMPLASRLADGTLAQRYRERLNAYMAKKLTQQNALRNTIDSVAGETPSVRKRELAAFAAAQTPELDALEKEADDLRHDIINGIFIIQEDVNWNAMRTWHLGPSNFQTERDAVLAQEFVFLGAAYYTDDLLPEQRRLLRELAFEVEETSTQPDGEQPELAEDGITLRTDTSPLLFFSPHLSRVRLPATLPEPVLDKIARYEIEKSDIKKELADVLMENDAAVLGLARSRAIKRMIEEQRPRLAALEQLADEIRDDLVNYPLPRPKAPPPVPPALGARIEALLKDKEDSNQRLYDMLGEVEKLVTIERINTGSGPAGQQLLRVGMRSRDGDPESVRAANQIIQAFNQQTQARNRDAAREMGSVRDDLAKVLGPLPEPDLTDAINKVFEDYSSSMDELDLWVKYQDYRDAVLLPGLSPEQRRLLFDGAIERLNLPLPDSQTGPRETILQPLR